MRLFLYVLVLLMCDGRANTLAGPVPPELLTAKTAYLRDRSGDPKLSNQIREQLKQWGRWELSTRSKEADLVLVLSVEQKTVEKIRLKTLEEPHATEGDEEYEVRTLTARTRDGRKLVSFTTRPGWTAARDARELVQKFKDLLLNTERGSTK